ncbi:sensor histidine kinase [Methylophaga lonarensis]|uniref:sensor histidine kinase n=1 Tax=Methylophaga lonarensis TaxID=999151 RepID=UPI003D26F13F
MTWPIEEIAVLLDEAGTETIDTVSHPDNAHRFVPSPHGLNAGYSRNIHWLRIRLSAPADGRLLLEIQPPYLDDLKFFIPDGLGGFQQRQTGDLYPFSSRDLSARAFVLSADLAPDTSQTLYLRLETTSTSLLFLRAFQPEDYAAVLSKDYLLLGLYYGILLVLLLFNLWHGHWRHDDSHRAFLVYLAVTSLFMLSVNGLVAQFAAPEHPAVGHHLLSSMVMAMVAVAAWFHSRILLVDRSSPLLYRYFQGIMALCLVCFIAYLSGYFTEAARVITLISLTIPIVGISRTITLWRQKRAGSLFLAIAYGSSFLSYAVTVMSVQGLLSGSHWQLYSLQVGALIALLAFNFGLFERLRYNRLAHEAAVERERQARNELELQNRARQQQGALIDMLSHEIRTPLSVIRLRLEAGQPSPRMIVHAEQAVAVLEDIVERCDYANRLDNHAISVRSEACDLLATVNEGIAKYRLQHRVSLDCPSTVSTKLVSDTMLLSVLVANLIDNACKYALPGSVIAMRLTNRDAHGCPGVAFQIANHAAASTRPDPDKVFKRYYRAAGAQGTSGSGLGLAIAHSLAERLNGQLNYLHQEEAVTFELWLPQSMS